MRSLAGFVLLFAASGISCALAQETQKPRLGHAPTEGELRKWEAPALPDGTGLPKGSGSALVGKPIFLRRCAGCHGEHGEGHDPVGPQLVGGIGSLASKQPALTVGSYWPYATSVWDYIHRAMPYYPNPGTLSADETYAVTAYILSQNHIIGEGEVMDQSSLPKVHMPNRNGFIADPRPDLPARTHGIGTGGRP
jgi:mono/diheme cytochrome c family protein